MAARNPTPSLPPTQNEAYPTAVEKEVRELGYTDTNDIKNQREASGDLPDESPEDPVRNSTPFRGLKGGR